MPRCLYACVDGWSCVNSAVLNGHRSKWWSVALAVCALLGVSNVAHAASMMLAWDPDDDTTGYVLSYGTESGVYSSHIDVGNQTQYVVDGLAGDTTYYFVVQAYNAAGTGTASDEISGQTDPDSSTITTLTLTADQSPPQPPNTTIHWTATATGGVPPYWYKWWLSDGQSWTALTGWTSARRRSWTPTVESSSYQYAVWAKSTGNPADAPEQSASVPFPIQSGPAGSITSLTLGSDVSGPQPPGTPITFTASAQGGAQPYSFRYWLFDGSNWTLLCDWTASGVFQWTPTSANDSYQVAVWIRSGSTGADTYDASASIVFPIY